MPKKSNQQMAGQVLHDLFREVFELQASLSAIMDKVHERAGLSTSQHKIIRALSNLGPATVPDLAAALGVTRQFVQTVCNNLKASGFLEFKENPRHKRSRLLALTDAGRIAFQQARQKENEIIEKALPAIQPGKAEDAGRLLKSIRKAVQESGFKP
jgi:DNA-binding MarR family transcriptional regulator